MYFTICNGSLLLAWYHEMYTVSYLQQLLEKSRDIKTLDNSGWLWQDSESKQQWTGQNRSILILSKMT